MLQKDLQERIEAGKQFLLNQITKGICCEFHQLRHGPSTEWVTACVGSSLHELNAVPRELIEFIISAQRHDGGWGYNKRIPSDVDSTLRAIQFLKKINHANQTAIERGETFVVRHQNPDGGFPTYSIATVNELGYQGDGWIQSHPCVTAVATNVLRDQFVISRAMTFLKNHLKQQGPTSYWWKTPLYIQYELNIENDLSEPRDPVELGLYLLLATKQQKRGPKAITSLFDSQHSDGGFRPSKVFRIPRPETTLEHIGEEETIEDVHGIFSTCTAVVALSRQYTLLYT